MHVGGRTHPFDMGAPNIDSFLLRIHLMYSFLVFWEVGVYAYQSFPNLRSQKGQCMLFIVPLCRDKIKHFVKGFWVV